MTTNVERVVLQRFGVRWAVLAAWIGRLRGRGVTIPAAVMQELEEAQVKISSGCFASCEVGCVLRKIEGALTALDGSQATNEVDYWTEMVARSLDEKDDVVSLLHVEAIKVQYSECLASGCDCAS